jgi:hypothetical protein
MISADLILTQVLALLDAAGFARNTKPPLGSGGG